MSHIFPCDDTHIFYCYRKASKIFIRFAENAFVARPYNEAYRDFLATIITLT